MNSGKVVLGYPEGAPKMTYLAYHANRLGIPVARTLQETCALAVRHLKRSDSE